MRMTDLVRGRATTPARPGPPADPAAPTPPAAPPETGAEQTPSGRVDLRTLAGTQPATTPKAPPEPGAPASEIDAADDIFSRMLLVLERARTVVSTHEPFPWTELERVIVRAAGSVGQSGELFWLANSPLTASGTDPLTFHQARVAVLALRIGQTVGLDPSAVVQLGMAGALIDVGLWQLGDGRKIDPQSADYRTHPSVSAEIVRRFHPPHASIADAVAQHHELEQGQGFPAGLRAEAIHPHAKILALVDRYASLTGSGSARGRARPYEAIRDIVRSKGEEFAPALIKAFLGEISVFPPGTPVRLNTGEIARVIGVNRNHPLRPRVEVLSDTKGNPVAARVIDLADSPFVYITGPVTEST